MRGTVIKRGTGYSVVVDLGKGPDGKRIRKWHSGFRTRKDAERARIDLLAKLQAGAYVEPSKLTVGRFLVEQWLPSLRAQVKPRTHAWHQTNVSNHLVPAIGNIELQKLMPGHLNKVYADLDSKLSNQTIHHLHATIRRALADAVRWGLVNRNAAILANPPRPERHEMQTWSASELRTFLESVRTDRLYSMWLLASSTGMRRSELLNLRWRDVDLGAARVSVVESKTAAGRRSIAIDKDTVSALKAWRTAQLQERMLQGPAYVDSGLTFTRSDGSRLRESWLDHTFQRKIRQLGLPKITFHGLRHAHATIALAAGIHPKTMSARLGHASVSITLDLYSHAVPALEEEAAATVAALVLGD
jgi:integrase